MQRQTYEDILQVSTRVINLRVEDERLSSNGKQNFGTFQQAANSQNKIGLGSFSIASQSQRTAVIYKIRSNNPKNYRLANYCNVVEVGQVVQIDIKLVNAFLYRPKDLFELRYIEFTPQQQQVYRSQKMQSIYQFWQYVDENKSLFDIRSTQLTVELNDKQILDYIVSQNQKASQLTGGGGSTNLSGGQQSMHSVNQSPGNMRSTSPTISSSQSPFNTRSQFQLSSNSQRTQNGMSMSQNRRIGSQFGQFGDINSMSTSVNQLGQYQEDFKNLYEKLVIKVDEQDKQLFVLNEERKKLETDWKLLSKKQEQLKNSELHEMNSKNINGIQPISALIIAFISLLIGIYLGN